MLEVSGIVPESFFFFFLNGVSGAPRYLLHSLLVSLERNLCFIQKYYIRHLLSRGNLFRTLQLSMNFQGLFGL